MTLWQWAGVISGTLVTLTSVFLSVISVKVQAKVAWAVVALINFMTVGITLGHAL